MTKAHVPPQVAGNRGKVTSATVRLHNNVRSIGWLAAGGMWMRGLCGDCNSLAGLNYDSAYGDFAKALDTALTDAGLAASRCRPLAFVLTPGQAGDGRTLFQSR
ncbi:hypothetical protein SUDANB105_07901 [Streptomyces sp. enrichment culture]